MECNQADRHERASGLRDKLSLMSSVGTMLDVAERKAAGSRKLLKIRAHYLANFLIFRIFRI